MKSLNRLNRQSLSQERNIRKNLITIFASFLTILVLASLSFGQTSSDNTWNKTYGGPYGGSAVSVVQTDDGGFTLVGYYQFGQGYPTPESRNTWIIKTDSNGQTILDKKIDFGLNDMPIGLIQRSKGDYLSVGGTPGGFSDGVNTYQEKWYMFNFDSSGTLLWNQTSYGQPRKIAQTSNGDFAVLCIPEGGATCTDLCLFHASDPQARAWSRSFNYPDYTFANDLIATSDGGFVIGGMFWNKQVGGNLQAWIMKIDSGGNIQQNKTFGSYITGSMIDTLTQTADGGYLLAGCNGSQNIIIKTNSNADVQWTKNIGDGSVKSIIVTSDGGYALALKYSIDTYEGAVGILKVDSSGELQWRRWYNGTEVYKIIQTTDNGYAIVGEIPSGFYGKHDALFIKTNSTGMAAGEIQLPQPTPSPAPPPYNPTPQPTPTPTRKTTLPSPSTTPSLTASPSSLWQMWSIDPVMFAVLVVSLNFVALGVVVFFTKTRRKNPQNTVKTVEKTFSFCPYCGKELPKDASKVCPSCGNKLPPT